MLPVAASARVSPHPTRPEPPTKTGTSAAGHTHTTAASKPRARTLPGPARTPQPRRRPSRPHWPPATARIYPRPTLATRTAAPQAGADRAVVIVSLSCLAETNSLHLPAPPGAEARSFIASRNTPELCWVAAASAPVQATSRSPNAPIVRSFCLVYHDGRLDAPIRTGPCEQTGESASEVALKR